jgi:hypothetical protein
MGTLLEYSKIWRAMKIAKDVRLVLFHLRGFDSVDALTAKVTGHHFNILPRMLMNVDCIHELD